MIRFAKPALALGVVSAIALAMATPSEARNGRNAVAIGAGVAGFALGTAAAAAASPFYYGSYYSGQPYAYSYYGQPGYYDSYAYAPRTSYGGGYYGGDPSGYYAPTYATPRYRWNRAREDHLTGTGAGFID